MRIAPFYEKVGLTPYERSRGSAIRLSGGPRRRRVPDNSLMPGFLGTLP